jgi:hypothetical protein
MPYNPAILQEATFVTDIGPGVVEDKIYPLYNAILQRWFPATQGFFIGGQVDIGGDGKPDFMVVRHQGPAGLFRNTLLIVELKRPGAWNPQGREHVITQLRDYMEACFQAGGTQHATIYGLAGIGFHWTLCSMAINGPPQPLILVEWQDNIVSNASYLNFKDYVAPLLYNM